jgi:hypothetical protein
MSRKGYDLFAESPNSVEERRCAVCGATCHVERNAYGPTGVIEAMCKSSRYHDRFKCPNSGAPWHEHALELLLAIKETPSKRVAELITRDLAELLAEHDVRR